MCIESYSCGCVVGGFYLGEKAAKGWENGSFKKRSTPGTTGQLGLYCQPQLQSVLRFSGGLLTLMLLNDASTFPENPDFGAEATPIDAKATCPQLR